jgi:hypothetical protein
MQGEPHPIKILTEASPSATETMGSFPNNHPFSISGHT